MALPLFAPAMALLALVHAAAAADYATEIKPLLKARCYSCHGALKQKAGLRLDTVALMRKGGESGDLLAAHSSPLLERVTAKDDEERMPPEGAPLTPEQVAAIKAWIAAGAPAPPAEKPEEDPRKHWAYQVPCAADVPMGASPIDSLLDRRLCQRGLKPQPEAAPEVWLRRVYIDLTGLPPTAAEVRAYVAAAAAEPKSSTGEATPLMHQTVERLLASPAYGERWARHFMDLWRYSDWYGLGSQLRNSQKHIWHWRDWIVESLNADKGYDRMIVEMLAADEAAPEDRDALRATGFLCRNYYLFNRTTWLDEVVEHTSRAFLGVTMQCVKCHDHKYDPIAHTDYYRMRAVFEPYHVRLDAAPKEPDFEKDGLPRAFDLHLERPTYLHRRGDDKHEDKSRPIPPGVPDVLRFRDYKPEPVALPQTAVFPVLQPHVLEDQLRAAEREAAATALLLQQARGKRDQLGCCDDGRTAERDKAEAGVALAEAELVAAQARPPMLVSAAAAERGKAEGKETTELRKTAAQAAAAYQYARACAELAKAHQAVVNAPADKKAEANKKERTAEQAVTAARKKVEAPGEKYSPVRATLKAQEGPTDKTNADFQAYPSTSSGRRLALARWIADQRNPLTARVLVNHLWLRHFGASLVPDVSDFGLRCPPPLHQDVLDTLAVDFMQHGWSLKRLHRAMVLSQLYRRGSSSAHGDAATVAADPENAYYWRINPRRVESQAVRDCVLHAAGRLDLRVGGPSVDATKEEGSLRRALYFTQTAETEHRFLAAFDNSNVLECYRRQESIVPQQALALANSRVTRESAEAIAKRLESVGDEKFVEEAFLTLLSRAPTADERAACKESLSELAKVNGKRSRAVVLQALMSHDDFVTLR